MNRIFWRYNFMLFQNKLKRKWGKVPISKPIYVTVVVSTLSWLINNPIQASYTPKPYDNASLGWRGVTLNTGCQYESFANITNRLSIYHSLSFIFKIHSTLYLYYVKHYFILFESLLSLNILFYFPNWMNSTLYQQ